MIRKRQWFGNSGASKIRGLSVSSRTERVSSMSESGKTAFLEALHQANPFGGPGRGLDELRDYPRRLRGRDGPRSPGRPRSRPPSSWTTPTWRRWPERIGPDALGAKELTVERAYSARRLLVGDDEVGSELADELASRLPRLLYFDGYSVLPAGSRSRSRATAEDAPQPGERTALALLRLAGVAADEFVESRPRGPQGRPGERRHHGERGGLPLLEPEPGADRRAGPGLPRGRPERPAARPSSTSASATSATG